MNHREAQTDEQILDIVGRAALQAETTIVTVNEQFFQKAVTPRLETAKAALANVKTILDQLQTISDPEEKETKLGEGEAALRKFKEAERRYSESDRIFDQVEHNRKTEDAWEKTVWTVPASELLPGEHIAEHAGILVLVIGTSDTRHADVKTDHLGLRWDCRGKYKSPTGEIGASCVVKPPIGITAHILMERLRKAIADYAAIRNAEDAPTASDAFAAAWLEGWRSAWFDGRNLYCRYSPRAKYIDLSNEEQSCK